MTATSTFGTLRSAIMLFLDRANDPLVTPLVPTWVGLAEESIAEQVRARCMVQRATQPVTTAYVPLPCDWLAFLDIRDESGRTLTFLSRLDDPVPVAGPVSAYRLVGKEIEILPHVDPATTTPPSIEVAYFAMPPALTADTDTNALLQEHTSIYLYGALVHAAVYLHDPDAAKIYDATFQQAVAAANGWHEASRFSGGRLNARMRGFG